MKNNKDKENIENHELDELEQQKKRIDNAIKRSGKSKALLYKELGFSSQSKINYMIKRSKYSHLKHIAKIAKFCNVSEAYLLRGEKLTETFCYFNNKKRKGSGWDLSVKVSVDESIIEDDDYYYIVRSEDTSKVNNFYLFLNKSSSLECAKRLICFDLISWSTSNGKKPHGKNLGRIISMIKKK